MLMKKSLVASIKSEKLPLFKATVGHEVRDSVTGALSGGGVVGRVGRRGGRRAL
jgi:hypothetical protein